MDYVQSYNPTGNAVLSTLLAALPVLVLFFLLVIRRVHAPVAALGGAGTALLVAILLYRMPVVMAFMSFLYGAAFGILPIAWVVINAMLLYNLTVVTGKFDIVRRSVAALSPDHRLQAVLIGFSFGAFLEGAGGGGSPVAICGALLVGLGFNPFQAACLCLLANTSPVVFGALGTPIVTLTGVTGIAPEKIAATAGRQLPFLSAIIPLWMVRTMVPWKKTFEVLPALLVAGVSFSVSQYWFANHPKLWGLCDIASAIISLLVSALFLRFWRPRETWRCPGAPEAVASPVPLRAGEVLLGWLPFGILFLLFMGLAFTKPRLNELRAGPLAAVYDLEVPGLNERVRRGEEVLSAEQRALPPEHREREKAKYRFDWLTASGSVVLYAALLSAAVLRPTRAQVKTILERTVHQMKVPVPTISTMMGLGFVTKYAGLDATLGLAFTKTGVLYPFFAALLGWLGVFLTGTDAASNALFGSLQKITAQSLGLNPVLIATSNSTGGVMGKMIDAQSICVATAATGQVGREADIFKFVVWHSLVLACLVGVIVLLQAYVWPGSVPNP
jgi:lactate permease